jgi:hypothetical protein
MKFAGCWFNLLLGGIRKEGPLDPFPHITYNSETDLNYKHDFLALNLGRKFSIDGILCYDRYLCI